MLSAPQLATVDLLTCGTPDGHDRPIWQSTVEENGNTSLRPPMGLPWNIEGLGFRA